MMKEELWERIKNAEVQISDLEEKLNRQEEIAALLEEFSKKHEQSVCDFEESIERRKQKLCQNERMRGTTHFAASYMERVREELTGFDYREAVNNITLIRMQLDEKKQKTAQEICSLNRAVVMKRTELEKYITVYAQDSEKV